MNGQNQSYEKMFRYTEYKYLPDYGITVNWVVEIFYCPQVHTLYLGIREATFNFEVNLN